jgi:membrane protein
VKRFITHRCSTEARSLSFVTLLSLVPLITVFLAVFSQLPYYTIVKEKLVLGIANNFLPEKTQQLSEYLETILSGGRSIGFIGIVFSVIMAFSLIMAFSRVVNNIWNTRKRNHVLLSFMKFLAIIVLGPLLIILTFMLQNFVFIQKLIRFFYNLLSTGNGELSGSLVHIRFTRIFSLVLNWLLLTFLYSLIPHTKVKFGYAFLAGVFTGTVWYFVRLGLNLYVKVIPQMNVLYGSLAFFPIFLIWIYISWIVLLFGVELTYSLHIEVKKISVAGEQ